LLTVEDILFGTAMIEILQRLFPSEFVRLFAFITILGAREFLLGLTGIVYWCFDKHRGRVATYVLLIGASLNFWVKIAIAAPRPPENLHLIDVRASPYGFPSGHAQDTASVWTWIALDFEKVSVLVFSAALMVLVGLTRIYLGIHFPYQVVAGWLIGLTVVAITRFAHPRVFGYGKMKTVAGYSIPILAILLSMIATLSGFVESYSLAQIGGYLLGFWAGDRLEERYVSLERAGNLFRIFRRAILGAALNVLTLIAFSVLSGDGSAILSLTNFLILGIVVSLVIPLVFRKLGF
jgi:membrane-associated phospholipid phosphatase